MSNTEIILSGNNTELQRRIIDMLSLLELPFSQVDATDLTKNTSATSETEIVIFCFSRSETDLQYIHDHFDERCTVFVTDSIDDELTASLNSGHLLGWPFGYEALKKQFDLIIKSKSSPEGRRKYPSAQSIEGNSQAVQIVRDLISKVADTDASVLIHGESGTGKEIAARMIHRQSGRSDMPFVAINCGAIPKDLLESELFGHEKGSFTGAISARTGRFEQADGGTLFLDEIGDMDLAMQVKLLRVLQESSFQRVGSNKTLHSDVRIIAATHRNLEEMIAEGTFREDLFYRLNVFPIQIPALRKRKEDLPSLAASMIKRLDRERGVFAISSEAMEQLQAYHWPGNIRELSNLVERLRVLHLGEEVQATDLPDKYRLIATGHNGNQSHPDSATSSTNVSYIAHDTNSVATVQLAKKVAENDSPVLISGESGCGKEVLARTIHQNSPRARQPFIIINCALLDDNNLDQTLFGEELTQPDGQIKIIKGKFEQAQGGTILLDEISNMTASLQAKILRLVQSHEVERVGGKSPITIDARIIATTNHNLQQAIKAGEFREDLYFRLNVFPITIQALRNRPEDVLQITDWYLQRFPAIDGQYWSLSEAARQKLSSHAWPGNVRELCNVIQRAAVNSDSTEIDVHHLCIDTDRESIMTAVNNDSSLNNGLRSHEQELILEALHAGNGNRKFAAEKLGISPRTLRYKIAKMREAGIELPNA